MSERRMVALKGDHPLPYVIPASLLEMIQHDAGEARVAAYKAELAEPIRTLLKAARFGGQEARNRGWTAQAADAAGRADAYETVLALIEDPADADKPTPEQQAYDDYLDGRADPS